jgi:surface antigen
VGKSSHCAIAALIFSAVLAIGGQAEALQCVPFAREVSGIGLKGDAWTWWTSAAGLYDRGQAPHPGAVMVFKKHGKMRHGHVAVVTRVVGTRQVLVEHANWAPYRGAGRGKVSTLVAVVDISPRNDWTQVRVWNEDSQDFGLRIYPTYGFIYPNAAAAFSAIQKVSAALPPRGSLIQAEIARAEAAPTKPVEPVPTVTKNDGAPAMVAGLPRSEAAPAQDKPVAAKPGAAPAEGVWEGDAAAARQVGSGRYGR